MQTSEEKEVLFEKLARRCTVTNWLAGVPVDAAALFARNGAIWTGYRHEKQPVSSSQRARSASKGDLLTSVSPSKHKAGDFPKKNVLFRPRGAHLGFIPLTACT